MKKILSLVIFHLFPPLVMLTYFMSFHGWPVVPEAHEVMLKFSATSTIIPFLLFFGATLSWSKERIISLIYIPRPLAAGLP